MAMKTKRCQRTHTGQFEIYVEYLAQYEQLRTGFGDPFTLNRLWNELAAELNAYFAGPSKSPSEWRSTLLSWKYSARCKARSINKYGHGTGCGKLTELEKRALSLWDREESAGLPDRVTPISFDINDGLPTINQQPTTNDKQHKLRPKHPPTLGARPVNKPAKVSRALLESDTQIASAISLVFVQLAKSNEVLVEMAKTQQLMLQMMLESQLDKQIVQETAPAATDAQVYDFCVRTLNASPPPATSQAQSIKTEPAATSPPPPPAPETPPPQAATTTPATQNQRLAQQNALMLSALQQNAQLLNGWLKERKVIEMSAARVEPQLPVGGGGGGDDVNLLEPPDGGDDDDDDDDDDDGDDVNLLVPLRTQPAMRIKRKASADAGRSKPLHSEPRMGSRASQTEVVLVRPDGATTAAVYPSAQTDPLHVESEVEDGNEDGEGDEDDDDSDWSIGNDAVKRQRCDDEPRTPDVEVNEFDCVIKSEPVE